MDQKLKMIVSEAQNYDGKGNYKAAYVKYLESIQNVSQQLLSSATSSDGFQNVKYDVKLIGLATMCIQRTDDILRNKLDVGELTSPGSPLLARAEYQPSTPNVFNIANSESPSPLELAERRNRQLMSAYRERLSNANKHKATDLSLSLHRRLAENLAIARDREIALAKKRAERRIRLEAETSKRFSASPGMSKDELERRYMYTKILEFEQESKWLLPWREKLKANPQDCLLIQQLIERILGSPKHPLSQLMGSYHQSILNKMKPLLQQWSSCYRGESHSDFSYTKSLPNIPHSSCSEDISFLSLPPVPSANSLNPEVMYITCTDFNSPSSQTPPDSGVQSFSVDDYDVSIFDDLFESSLENSDPENSSKTMENSHETPPRKNVENPERNRLLSDMEHPGQDVSSNDITRRDHSYNSDHDSDDGGYSASYVVNDNDKSNNALNLSTETSENRMENFEREAVLPHLQGITRQVQDSLELLVTMFIVAYDSLDNATGRDSCYSALELPFYQKIWTDLITLYRLVNKHEESLAVVAMAQHMTSSPHDLGIPRKFCLLPEDSLLMPEGYEPYMKAVKELQGLSNMVSPLSKLECIVQVSRTICKCVDEFYGNNRSKTPSIGADDLLPILSYVVIKSQVPQILAECYALEDLVHEGYLMGEEGYCLTSLETAIKYVITLGAEKSGEVSG